MNGILNIVRREIERSRADVARTRLATVTSYDDQTYMVKVEIQPEGHETGWIPIASPWVGEGWGLFAPPSVGDQVEVEFQEHDDQSGMVCHRLFNDVDVPVAGVKQTEFFLIHKTGSCLKFKANGDVEIHVAGNLTMEVEGNITSSASRWDHEGDLYVEGDVSDSNGSMQEMRDIYNSHNGHGSGGPPSPQMN